MKKTFFTVEESTLLESIISSLNPEDVNKEKILSMLLSAPSEMQEIIKNIIQKIQFLSDDHLPHLNVSNSLFSESTSILHSPYSEADKSGGDL